MSLGATDQLEAPRQLQSLVAARTAIDNSIDAQVKHCLTIGVTATAVGQILGITQQAVQKRWASRGPRKLAATQWFLAPGERISRGLLHDRLGGNRQTGVSIAKDAGEIFLFAESGEQHGYQDGWVDGVYLYTGEGQPARGDQTLTRGNKALARHKQDGRRVRLFQGAKGLVTYVGSFEVDDDEPFIFRSANSPNGARTVIVFRLRPKK